jgi:hypothetical protein
MMAPDLETVLMTIASHRRRASIAQVGGFRPPADPLTSWFGGHFVALGDEPWPQSPDGPMVPLLQLRVAELPCIHEALADVALLTVFVGQRLPVDTPVPNGSGWVLREYRSLEDLVPSASPDTGVRPFPVIWRLHEGDAPQWEAAWSICDMAELNRQNDAVALYSSRFSTSYATKVGGWPSYIQGSPVQPTGQFVLQIATEPKANWAWGDSGNGYFYRDTSGHWWLDWDCY